MGHCQCSATGNSFPLSAFRIPPAPLDRYAFKRRAGFGHRCSYFWRKADSGTR